MARNTKLKVIRLLSVNGPGGDYKPIEEYSAQEISDAVDKMLARASESASIYFSNHPEQLAKLCPESVVKVSKKTG